MKAKISLFFMILLLVSFVNAIDCPRGLINDPYPGECGLYTDLNQDGICDLSQDNLDANKNLEPKNYFMWQIALLFFVLYAISILLVKKDILTIVQHRKIWNLLLLISFFITAVTSIILLLNINYGFIINIGGNISFLHIEVGWIMIIISIFHMLWHIPYFKSILKF